MFLNSTLKTDQKTSVKLFLQLGELYSIFHYLRKAILLKRLTSTDILDPINIPSFKASIAAFASSSSDMCYTKIKRLFSTYIEDSIDHRLN